MNFSLGFGYDLKKIKKKSEDMSPKVRVLHNIPVKKFTIASVII